MEMRHFETSVRKDKKLKLPTILLRERKYPTNTV